MVHSAKTRGRERERERGRNGRAESSSRGRVELGNVSVMHGISWWTAWLHLMPTPLLFNHSRLFKTLPIFIRCQLHSLSTSKFEPLPWTAWLPHCYSNNALLQHLSLRFSNTPVSFSLFFHLKNSCRTSLSCHSNTFVMIDFPETPSNVSPTTFWAAERLRLSLWSKRSILGGVRRPWAGCIRLMAQGQIPSEWCEWKLP